MATTMRPSMSMSVRSPRWRARRKASQAPAAMAATYAMPYQRISSGPTARATGLGVKSIMVEQCTGKRRLASPEHRRDGCRGQVAATGGRLDEEGGVGLSHQLQGGRGADRLAHAIDQVLALDAEQVHCHLARDELDADCLRHLEQVLGLGDVVLLGQLEHHPRAHAHEVHLAQLAVADPGPLHE